jgi:hypothetical protein
MKSYLEERVVAPVWKGENTAIGICHANHMAPPLSTKVGTNFADKRRLLGLIVCSQSQVTEFLEPFQIFLDVFLT